MTSVFLQQQEQRPTPHGQTINNSIMQKETSQSHKQETSNSHKQEDRSSKGAEIRSSK